MSEDKKHTERINYIRTEGYFVGTLVNIPGIICQAKSLPELKRKMKVMFRMWVTLMMEAVEQDEPFDTKELSSNEWENQYQTPTPGNENNSLT